MEMANLAKTEPFDQEHFQPTKTKTLQRQKGAQVTKTKNLVVSTRHGKFAIFVEVEQVENENMKNFFLNI